MDWSFRILMVFAVVLGILALDHYVLGEALTGVLGALGRSVADAF
ncbi:MAG: hypothetical protein ACFBSD_12100 [Paracoccaceae bacterium]